MTLLPTLLRIWMLTATALVCLSCSKEEGGEKKGCAACDDGQCTLAQASDCAGIRVGVAAGPTDDPERKRLLTTEFNSLSAEGALLWSVIHPSASEWSFEEADRFVEFAWENHMPLLATHFVWDQAVAFSTTPDWVLAIDDPEELRIVMRNHMETLGQRYGEKIRRWIVVNEPLLYFGTELYPNHFYNTMGPDYIDQAFAIAAEKAPQSELWINDIFLASNPAKAEAYLALVSELLARGVPIDGAGVQGHFFYGTPDFAVLESLLTRLGALGIQTAITEMDAPVDPGPQQLEINAIRLASGVTACLRSPGCNTVTVWGLDDGTSWINWVLGPNMAPLLFDAALQPKPSYFAFRDALLTGP